MNHLNNNLSLLRGGLQSKKLQKHIVGIGYGQSLSTSALYIHKCLDILKKLYKNAGECEDQHQYKSIIESALVSKHKGCNDNSPMTYNPSVSNKNPSARKSLCQFTET